MAEQFGYGASGSSPPLDMNFFTDERLSALAVGILGRMLADPSYPKDVAGIVEREPFGRTVVRRVSRELKDAGYIEDQAKRGSNGMVHTVTILHRTAESGSPVQPEGRFLTFGEMHRRVESGSPVATRDDEVSAQVRPEGRIRPSMVHRDVVDEQSVSLLHSTNGLAPISTNDKSTEGSSTSQTNTPRRLDGRNRPSGDLVEYEAEQRERELEEHEDLMCFLDELGVPR